MRWRLWLRESACLSGTHSACRLAHTSVDDIAHLPRSPRSAALQYTPIQQLQVNMARAHCPSLAPNRYRRHLAPVVMNQSNNGPTHKDRRAQGPTTALPCSQSTGERALLDRAAVQGGDAPGPRDDGEARRRHRGLVGAGAVPAAGPFAEEACCTCRTPGFAGVLRRRRRLLPLLSARARGPRFPRFRVVSPQDVNWEERMAQITDKDLKYPEYYLAPFHAYPGAHAPRLPSTQGTRH